MDDFYEKNAELYFNNTIRLNSEIFLNPLTLVLAKEATVLDIGCGSGRDLLWLKNKGYNPVGFEKSNKLATLAKNYSSCEVISGDFFHYDFGKHQFSAIISIGSLVHAKHEELEYVLSDFLKALKPNGFLLFSLKIGDGYKQIVNSDNDQRVFTLWQPFQLEVIIKKLNITIVESAVNQSQLRSDDMWISYLVQKQA